LIEQYFYLRIERHGFLRSELRPIALNDLERKCLRRQAH
jgi:hypothetical protein